MRYFYPYQGNIADIDVQRLKKLLKKNGIETLAIHIGNGVLVFDTKSRLTDAEKETLRNIVDSYKPLQYAGKPVSTAEDVNKVTIERILDTFGGAFPVHRQLGFLTDLVETILGTIQKAKDFNDFKNKLSQQVQLYNELLQKRRQILNEAQFFKNAYKDDLDE